MYSPLCNSVTYLQRASEGGRRPSRVAKCMYTRAIVSKCLTASCRLNSLKEKTLIQWLFHAGAELSLSLNESESTEVSEVSEVEPGHSAFPWRRLSSLTRSPTRTTCSYKTALLPSLNGLSLK